MGLFRFLEIHRTFGIPEIHEAQVLIGHFGTCFKQNKTATLLFR